MYNISSGGRCSIDNVGSISTSESSASSTSIPREQDEGVVMTVTMTVAAVRW